MENVGQPRGGLGAAGQDQPEPDATRAERCVDLAENAGAGRIDFGNAPQLQQQRRGRSGRLAIDDLRQPVGGAEKQRALQLDHQDRVAPGVKYFQFAGIAIAARSNGIASILPANVRAAHAHHEQQHRQHDSDEHREHDIDGNRQQRDEQRDPEIERDGAALRRARPDQARSQLFGPGIDMLDGDHHDRRREHRARQIGKQRKQQRRRHQNGGGVDDDRKPAAAAISAVREARSDIDAAGDAAEQGRDRVGNAEANQQAIVAGAKLTGKAGQLGA